MPYVDQTVSPRKILSGVITVWSFVLFIILGVIAVAIFIMVPLTKTGWLIPICEWLFPILFVLFAISSRIRVREIYNAFFSNLFMFQKKAYLNDEW